MRIRQGGMPVKKALLFRVSFVLLFCSLIIYAIYLYRKIYQISYNNQQTPYLINSGEYFRNGNNDNFKMMAGSGSVQPPPDFAGSGGEAGASSALGGNVDEKQGSPVFPIPNKLIHFDLKGMPPTVEAYKTIFPFIRGFGATGVLMEYEDMFPFHGKLQPIANKQAYSPSDIARILELAKASNLQVKKSNNQ